VCNYLYQIAQHYKFIVDIICAVFVHFYLTYFLCCLLIYFLTLRHISLPGQMSY